MSEEAANNPRTGWTTTEAAIELIVEAIDDALASQQPIINFAGRQIIYVSKGTAATDTRGSVSKYSSTVPFATLTAAQTAAVSGDLISVEPGTYAEAGLGKNGVNWYFPVGANITYAGDDTLTIWSDEAGVMTFTVFGYGIFTRVYPGNDNQGPCRVINCSRASSYITVYALDLISTDSQGDFDCTIVNQLAGTLVVNCRDMIFPINVSGTTYPVWWQGGSMFVKANKIGNTLQGYSVYSNVAGTATVNAYIVASEIYAAIYESGTNTNAAMWITCGVVHGGGAGGALNTNVASKMYLTAQKLFGNIIQAGTGLTYVTADKLEALQDGNSTNGCMIGQSAGTLRMTVPEMIPGTFIGEMITLSGGTLRLNSAVCTGIAGSIGVTQSGGTMFAKACTFDTKLNNATNPDIKSGGTQILDDVTLLAEATRAPIFATTAQNVIVKSAFTNSLIVDSDVTEQVGTTVRNALIQ